MANDKNIHGTVDTTGDAIGAATGGAAGAATGAALGSLGGPIGTIIGGLAGAVGGWWSGRAVSEAASTYSQDDDAFYRSHYTKTAGASSRTAYDDTRPAYQLGHLAGMNPDYQGRAFADVEPHLRQAYTGAGRTDWSDVRGYAQDAYTRGRDVGEQRLTLAEEELRVGKRSVQTGEVGLRKTVETEHVSQSIPLVHEEVTIERRPVSSDRVAAGHVEITEDEIRIPVMAEEAVVEKRVVGVEEVILRKEQVTETQTVEADLRKERLDIDRGSATVRTAGTTDAMDTSSRGGKSLGDKIANAVDDVKDRIDGNPASKPGRDRTDR